MEPPGTQQASVTYMSYLLSPAQPKASSSSSIPSSSQAASASNSLLPLRLKHLPPHIPEFYINSFSDLCPDTTVPKADL